MYLLVTNQIGTMHVLADPIQYSGWVWVQNHHVIIIAGALVTGYCTKQDLLETFCDITPVQNAMIPAKAILLFIIKILPKSFNRDVQKLAHFQLILVVSKII